MKKIIIDYDKKGDVFYLGFEKPTKSEYGEQIMKDVFVFIDEKTKKLIGIEIIGFSNFIKRKSEINIPISLKI